ncbi:MAG: hypothetical protein LBQ68_08265 [Clostridiales bacterium]|jgi:hypothetical protein|nr:hypothetical protein [Clostridiales bacterium]
MCSLPNPTSLVNSPNPPIPLPFKNLSNKYSQTNLMNDFGYFDSDHHSKKMIDGIERVLIICSSKDDNKNSILNIPGLPMPTPVGLSNSNNINESSISITIEIEVNGHKFIFNNNNLHSICISEFVPVIRIPDDLLKPDGKSKITYNLTTNNIKYIIICTEIKAAKSDYILLVPTFTININDYYRYKSKIREYKFKIFNTIYEVSCPDITITELETIKREIYIPIFMSARRHYPIYVYLYAIDLYCRGNISQRKVAEIIRKEFKIERFSHSTISRVLKKVDLLANPERKDVGCCEKEKAEETGAKACAEARRQRVGKLLDQRLPSDWTLNLWESFYAFMEGWKKSFSVSFLWYCTTLTSRLAKIRTSCQKRPQRRPREP